MTKIEWPEGKSFAFTVVDDTDHATVARVRPVYDLLHECGMRSTKTVWVYGHENDRYDDTETLEDPHYLDFIKELRDSGFEIAFHGARGISSEREITLRALEDFRSKLGFYPRMHVNHAQNKDNLYWTFTRLFKIQQWLHQTGIKKYGTRGTGYGAEVGSPYFWGDRALEIIDYVRAGSFRDIDSLACEPWMPWRERRFPYVNAWFSGSGGMQYKPFYEMLAPENQDRLCAGGGLCILNTHFGLEGFVDVEKGRVNAALEERIRRLSEMKGWFVPASEILDFLKERNGGLTQPNPYLRWWRTRNL